MNRKEFTVVAKSTVSEFTRNDISLLAAGLTYFLFLSLFPLLLLGVLLFSIFVSTQDALNFVTQNLTRMMDPASAKLLADVLISTLEGRDNSWLLFIFSFGLVLFSASNAFNTLDKAVNMAWGSEKMPNVLVSRLFSFGMVAVAIALLVASVAVSTALTQTRAITTAVIGEPQGTDIFWWAVTFATSLALVFLVFSLMYRFLPRRDVNMRDVYPGALIAAIAWVLLKELFALYLGSAFANFSSTYGTLGTVVALLTWIYLSSLIILTGAEFTAETYRVRRLRQQIISGVESSRHSSSPWFSAEKEPGAADVQEPR
jgi:membrane protein